jgi:hypothetical protein
MPTAAFVAKFRNEFEAYLKDSQDALVPELAVV